jgi:hypothetical protein
MNGSRSLARKKFLNESKEEIKELIKAMLASIKLIGTR